MPQYTGILVRDSQQDTGVVPSPGYPYTSPDIMCVQQQTYADPGAQFGSASSYNSNPNLPMINGQNNNFYVRGKNLGSIVQGGNMYVYWSKASLVMTPSLWFNQPLTSLINNRFQPYVALPSVAAGQVSVAATPFSWTPPSISPNDHYCLVGAVNTVSPYNWPPAQAPVFSSYDEFVLWVRNNQNICWRNLSLITNPNQPQWDRIDSFGNPYSQPAPVLFSAQCQNVPVGTSITLLCAALGVNVTQVTTIPNQTVYSQGATVPPGFNGLVETSARLPSGTTSWPAGAAILTTAYVGMSTASPAAHLAHDFGADNQHPSVLAAKELVRKTSNTANAGVLVQVGNCSTAYNPV